MGKKKKIKRILIANRGEIAVRIIKTCRLMNIETVAICTPPDEGSLFTIEADFCHRLHSSNLTETYLNCEVISDIALQYHCDSVHPGYGFLSERAGFASMCEKKGLIFIGPDAGTIELMGDKIAARKKVRELGIPLLEGVTGNDDKILLKKAAKMELPLLIKAAAGGGGRGMRTVRDKKKLKDELLSAKREALNAFGDDTVYIETYLENCRHIEVQILSDTYGNHLHLFERECSVQRRHQKVIEESPSSALNEQQRQDICRAAVSIAEGVNYRSAGTVEFLWSEGKFYFLEMNTRIQVEHPVTEMITGVDIIKQQIIIAEEAKLNFTQMDLKISGHAIEARVYAEDPYKNYLPSTGKILAVGNTMLDNIRIETAFSSGIQVPVEYDSMLAKVAAFDFNRQDAISRLTEALKGLKFSGVKNNISFLRQILNHQDFIRGNTFTSFLESNSFSEENNCIPPEIIAAALLIHSDSADESIEGNPWVSK